ncbi:MAG: restriction endonuclease subunit S [Dermatophilaceae bacterium]
MTPLPTGWSEGALGDVCRVVSGATPKTGVPQYWGGEVPWVTPNDMSQNRAQVLDGGERTLTKEGYASCSTRLFPEGSVIVSSRAPVGYVAIAGREMCTNQGCKTAVPPDSLDSSYLYWYLVAAKPDLEARASGTTFKEISSRRFAETRLRWPDLRMQRRIVEILEEHLSRIDAAEAELARARPRNDALLLTVLRAHVEELRSVGAPFARIGDVAETNLGKMLDAKKAHGEPTPYLANINVRWGRFDLENLKVVPLTMEERNRLTMQPGDVIVCEGGEPGRCAVWDLDNSGIAYQKALHRVRVHDTGLLEPKYLALMLRESIQSGRVNRLFTGTTIKHLPQEKLRLIEVPVPEHSVQEVALEELAAVALSGERLAAALQIAKLRSDSLRRAVLAAAFEGKLTGRHTDVEVIEELAQQ